MSVLDDTQLFQEREVIFEVPVFRDLPVGHPVDIRRDEIDGLPGALLAMGLAGEVALEVQQRDDAIAADDQLIDVAGEVGHGAAEHLRCG